jgi:hypothetical protein
LGTRKPSFRASTRQPPGLVEELEGPDVLASEIIDHLGEAASAMEDMRAELASSSTSKPRTSIPWIVFVPGAGEDARPAIIEQSNRWAAEREVSHAFGLPVAKCYAIPAELASNVVAALPFDEHPRRRKEPVDFADALAHARKLGAILPNSIRFRDDALTVEVRGMLEADDALITENPFDAFRSVGAMVHTVTATLTRGA